MLLRTFLHRFLVFLLDFGGLLRNLVANVILQDIPDDLVLLNKLARLCIGEVELCWQDLTFGLDTCVVRGCLARSSLTG